MTLRIGLLLLVVAALGCTPDASAPSSADDVAADITASDTPVAPPNCSFPDVTVPSSCTTCHGAPPDIITHPPNPACWRCHGHVVDKDLGFLPTELHKNGAVDVMVGCSSCHGWDLGVSPPQGLSGECLYGGPGVGAHAAMRRYAIPAHRTGCVNCHQVPTEWDDGHIDGDAEVVFRGLAVRDGAAPVWDGDTCSGVYCHGATLAGGDHKVVGWWDTDGAASRCGACHQLTDPSGDPDADCHSCHPSSVGEDQQPLPFGNHINGRIDLTDDAGRDG
jgi:predicted CxxxxCH...CXXCH cytochrome family protein